MKKIAIMLLILVALLTMAQECQTGKKQDSNRVTFIGGSTGLSPQWTEEAPPAEVFDMGQDPFDVEIRLLNVGEADIPKDKVRVVMSGLNPTDFGKTEADFIKDGISHDIEASYLDSQGNKITAPEVYVTFSGLNYRGTLTGNRVWPIWVDVCYSYSTIAETDGCIKRDVRSVRETVCEASGTKEVFNSGAPIQVVKFEQVPSGTDRVRYFFTIKHVGTGRVFSPDSRCGTDRANENKLHFRIDSTVADLECTGFLDGGSSTSGTVLLRNGEITVRCLQQKASTIDYVDPITITLTYDYQQSLKKDLLVKKST